MKKIISYSLFKGQDELAEIFYVRGFYFNCLMNSLVYPGWQTTVYTDKYIQEKYSSLLNWVMSLYGVKPYSLPKEDYTHCQKMLIRMAPCFWDDVEFVICRDADALTSYKEANAVWEWTQGNCVVHSIHDNAAHTTPIMGGLCGFKALTISSVYTSFDKMIGNSPVKIEGHGTDQDFLTRIVYTDLSKSMMLHNFKGVQSACSHSLKGFDVTMPFEEINKKLWVSDLCTSFIGAAGYNEMETLRFFRDFLPDFMGDRELWLKYPKLFYWA